LSKVVLAKVDSSLTNDDLAPTTSAHRTWGTYNYIALWFSMSMEITTYQLASSLIAKGMDWKQAVGTVLLGNLIVLVPMLLNAHAGAKYGIPFPVFIRAPFGVRGANIPAVMRALVACGWFGIQSWIGGQAIHSMLVVIWPSVAQVDWALWACFLGFWLLNMVVVWRGVESIRFLQGFAAPFMFIMAAALLIWVRIKAGSFGSMLSTPSKFQSWHDFLPVFFPTLTGMVGYWATLALNIPDFTRYSKSQGAQIVGQGFGLPVAMTLYTFVGIAVTSASVVLFGVPRAHRDPGSHAERKHRRQRRLSIQRLFEFISATDQLSHRWHDHRIPRPRHPPMEADGKPRRLYLRMARRLRRPDGPHRRHHDLRLLLHSAYEAVALFPLSPRRHLPLQQRHQSPRCRCSGNRRNCRAGGTIRAFTALSL
jgi:hypothetical protein